MSINKTFSILFRKFPVFRALSILGVIFFILLLVSLITHQAKKVPEIYSENHWTIETVGLIIINVLVCLRTDETGT